MGYILTEEGFQDALKELRKEYRIFAPVRKKGAGRFTDIDAVIYDEVEEGTPIELEAKSDYSAKEALTPLSETLFFFTEEQCKEADIDTRPVLLFLRSCDLQAMKRLDDMYLHNGREQDWFYQRRREKLHYVLIGCGHSYENCFCVDMGQISRRTAMLSRSIRLTTATASMCSKRQCAAHLQRAASGRKKWCRAM